MTPLSDSTAHSEADESPAACGRSPASASARSPRPPASQSLVLSSGSWAWVSSMWTTVSNVCPAEVFATLPGAARGRVAHRRDPGPDRARRERDPARHPRDLAGYGAAVTHLLTDPQRAEQIGRQARERVRDRFTSVRSLLDYVEVIRGVLQPA
jgi:hypothetical protein